MMQYDFDEVINRRGTDSYKWDKANDPDWVIPMPVADMDFRCATPILDRIKEITTQGIFGYSDIPQALIDQLIYEQKNKYGWAIEKEWIVWLPGLVPGLGLACKAVGEIGDCIMTPVPIYHHFYLSIAAAGKNRITTSLIEKNNRLTLNFEEIEQSIDSKTSLFLLCNPQNPGGTVFTKSELEKLSAICLRNKTVICSDEIHAELLIDPSIQHVPIASLSKEIEQNSITLVAPSKTYNIAGLGCSAAIIPNKEIRSNFEKVRQGIVPIPGKLANEAALVAYQKCGDWKEQMLSYIRKNHEYLHIELNQIQGVKMLPLQATYLAWIDFRALNIVNLEEKLVKNGLRLNPGAMFLAPGYMRLNFATTFDHIKLAVERIKKTVFEK